MRIQVIGISQDDAVATRGFANRFGVTFPTLLDLVGARSIRPATPTASHPFRRCFWSSRDGIVARAFAGFSKRDFEEIGARAGVAPFGPDDHVPEWKAG